MDSVLLNACYLSKMMPVAGNMETKETLLLSGAWGLVEKTKRYITNSNRMWYGKCYTRGLIRSDVSPDGLINSVGREVRLFCVCAWKTLFLKYQAHIINKWLYLCTGTNAFQNSQKSMRRKQITSTFMTLFSQTADPSIKETWNPCSQQVHTQIDTMHGGQWALAFNSAVYMV